MFVRRRACRVTGDVLIFVAALALGFSSPAGGARFSNRRGLRSGFPPAAWWGWARFSRAADTGDMQKSVGDMVLWRQLHGR